MGLIRVLLVDDNQLAMEYLSCLIDWKAAGFEVVGKAIDGKEALRSYEALSPQLLITDISMPGMDGIALSQEIRKRDEKVRIIFLSSYDEFDYARSALKLKVSEYILKHELDEETLLDKLSSVREEFLKEEDALEAHAKEKSKEEDVYPCLPPDLKIEDLSRYTRLTLSYVNAHYQNVDLSVDEVADHIGIGVNYLNQVFREETDMTVHRYLSQVRLEKAKELLACTQMKIGSIPEQVGYADSSYFSKVFKKATGLTPYAYRQKS